MSDSEYRRLDRSTSELEPPFALVDLDAFWFNANDLVKRAAGKPIRVASKSVRCRELLQRVLERPGFEGVMAFTLPEALWLAECGFSDILVAYPTADRAALAQLGEVALRQPESKITLMVDSLEQLDLIEAAVPRLTSPEPGEPLRICLDLDASYWAAGGRLKIGAKRSPLHDPASTKRIAAEVVARPGLKLVGLMGYEGQIAGVGDRPPGNPVKGAVIRAMQSASSKELAERRGAAVAAVRELADLEFVNGGGTGSLEQTGSEVAVTELAAGSGLYAPTLFDAYSRFTPKPAALFALPVVRRPAAGCVTVLGGGYIASGPAGSDRLPSPYLPGGLKLDGMEGAGEVQTPVIGPAADTLRVGDRVYFRHTKAGELCERFNELVLLEGDALVGHTPTYRGEGKSFA